MNTKILMSVLVIGLTAMAVGGAMTGAWFSDTATSTSNSFAAGTLDLKLANDGEPPYTDSVTGTFSADNMAPDGSETTGKVWLKNTGNVPADHVRITNVVNTPSDNGINSGECNAYGGEWKEVSDRYICVLPAWGWIDSETECTNHGGKWWSEKDRCFAEGDGPGFKGVNSWNNIDKHLQITSIKYDGNELKFCETCTWKVVEHQSHVKADKNGNGYLDLDDLEAVAAIEGSWLDNLEAPGTEGNSPKSFEMKVKLNEDAGNSYQSDENGIEITFQLNQQ